MSDGSGIQREGLPRDTESASVQSDVGGSWGSCGVGREDHLGGLGVRTVIGLVQDWVPL